MVSQAIVSGPVLRIFTKVKVTHHTATELDAVIDSGADENLMDWDQAVNLGLKSELVNRPIKARLLNGT